MTATGSWTVALAGLLAAAVAASAAVGRAGRLLNVGASGGARLDGMVGFGYR